MRREDERSITASRNYDKKGRVAGTGWQKVRCGSPFSPCSMETRLCAVNRLRSPSSFSLISFYSASSFFFSPSPFSCVRYRAPRVVSKRLFYVKQRGKRKNDATEAGGSREFSWRKLAGRGKFADSDKLTNKIQRPFPPSPRFPSTFLPRVCSRYRCRF